MTTGSLLAHPAVFRERGTGPPRAAPSPPWTRSRRSRQLCPSVYRSSCFLPSGASFDPHLGNSIPATFLPGPLGISAGQMVYTARLRPHCTTKSCALVPRMWHVVEWRSSWSASQFWHSERSDQSQFGRYYGPGTSAGHDSPSSARSVSTVHVGQPQPRKSPSPVRIAASNARARATGAQSFGSLGTRRRAAVSRCS